MAAPTIALEDGKLTFNCETEGAVCKYSVTCVDNKSGIGNELQLTSLYKISVYATKDGYEDSDLVTAEMTISGGQKGDLNDDGTIDVEDVVAIVNIILETDSAPAPQQYKIMLDKKGFRF